MTLIDCLGLWVETLYIDDQVLRTYGKTNKCLLKGKQQLHLGLVFKITAKYHMKNKMQNKNLMIT